MRATPMITAAAAFAGLTGVAAAEPLAFDANGRIVVTTGAFSADGEISPEAIGARAEFGVTASSYIGPGVRLGGGVQFAAESDHPDRNPRGGVVGDCPAGFADCPSVGGLPVAGPVSGFAGAGVLGRDEPRFAVEALYVNLEGPWGEVAAGRDIGAAARFSLAPPSVFAAMSSVDGSLDITGVGGAVVVNDLSGPATKVSYVSPRLLGLRLGASFTPDADSRGVDQGFRARGGLPILYEGDNVFEMGVSFARTWATGLRTDAAVTVLSAANDVAAPEFERLESVHAGFRLEQGVWRVGLASLWSDNGWAAGDRDYRSLAGSILADLGSWEAMLEASTSSDDLVHVDVITAQAGLRYEFSDRLAIAAGATWRERSAPVVTPAGRSALETEATGLFVEIAADL